MSKPNRKRLKMEVVYAQAMEATGDKYVEVEFLDADSEECVVRFLRQSWWPLALVKQLTGEAKMTGDDGETVDMSSLDRSLVVLRKVSHDKDLFDKLADQFTVVGFNAVMELITGEDANGVSLGESSSSSE
ncbi:hypothetical protein ABZ904_17980 [Streptomyces sp. NPDC046900]|uniref:hypothetical protein n=1 Tax=Streptomyces sp. NPDC046900 TaxID=3155473 RepID=UPI0033DB8BD2